ncbi:MAG: portal protein [Bdellovibrio sp.]
MEYAKSKCEYIRSQAKEKFDLVRGSWIEAGRWTLPHRTKWLMGQEDGSRNNHHIVDPTHVLALRSYVAGFLEGNTSASRPWFRAQHGDPMMNKIEKVKEWLEIYNRRCLHNLSRSNFYDAAAGFYYDFGVFNTGAYYIDELPNGRLHFNVLTPGAYYCLNNGQGVADTLVREFQLPVKTLIDTYARKKDGKWDWSNFSSRVRKLYENGNYTEKIDVVHIVMRNEHFNMDLPVGGKNRQWVSLSYESAVNVGYASHVTTAGLGEISSEDQTKYLKITTSKRKPFVVGRSSNSDNFEYGEKGPTTDSLGLIKSLQKKAIGKDIALDLMLKPPTQGPASLKKSYITNAPNSYVPLDAQSAAQGGLKQIYQISPAIANLNADVADLRKMIDRLYYSDFLLYLSNNPKTRTATEANAVVQEQQLVIGPNLQSLNWTHNDPVLDFIMEYTFDMDPYLPDAPEELQGESLRAEYISVFAQAQKAADLPSIDRYVDRMMQVAQLDPSVFQKLNLDKLADLYEDRLFLPVGLNNPQSEVDAKREQMEKQAQRQQMLNETLPALAGAAKDAGLVKPPGA